MAHFLTNDEIIISLLICHSQQGLPVYSKGRSDHRPLLSGRSHKGLLLIATVTVLRYIDVNIVVISMDVWGGLFGLGGTSKHQAV